MNPSALNGYDAAAVIVTDHSSIDYDVLVRAMPLVIDTRTVISRDSPFTHVVARA